MRVNGQEIILKEEIVLKVYLEQNNYNMERIAVERNGAIVPKSMYSECMLSDSDTLEIVHFVGGG